MKRAHAHALICRLHERTRAQPEASDTDLNSNEHDDQQRGAQPRPLAQFDQTSVLNQLRVANKAAMPSSANHSCARVGLRSLFLKEMAASNPRRVLMASSHSLPAEARVEESLSLGSSLGARRVPFSS